MKVKVLKGSEKTGKWDKTGEGRYKKSKDKMDVDANGGRRRGDGEGGWGLL